MDTTSGVAAPIQVMAMIAITDQSPSCSPIVKEGADVSVQGIVDYLTTHPGLDTTGPVPVEVGGYKGQSVDFTLASTWTATCPDHTGPYVLLLTDTGVPAGRALGYESTQAVRWDIVDVNGETVIIERATSSYGSKFEVAATEAQPVIDSIKFTPSN